LTKELTAMKNRRLLIRILGMVILGLICIYCNSRKSEQPYIDSDMIEAANEMNKNCPFMVDKNTRLDNTTAMLDNTFQFNFTLINTSKDKIDADTFKKKMQPILINFARTSPDAKIFRDEKIIINYNYKDRDGVFIVRLSVAPDIYLND
jgi:hypothetical protein